MSPTCILLQKWQTAYRRERKEREKKDCVSESVWDWVSKRERVVIPPSALTVEVIKVSS